MRLWTPSPNKRISELTHKIEATRFEIMQLTAKLDEAAEKIKHVNGHLESIGEALANIHSPEAKIVSLSEYVNLATDDKKIYDFGVQWSNVLVQLQKEIAAKEKDIAGYREEIEKIEHSHGRVLEFKKRG